MITLEIKKCTQAEDGGASRFRLVPEHISLGAMGANLVDELSVSIPSQWQDKTVRLTFIPEEGDPIAVVLDAAHSARLSADITGASPTGRLVADATDASGYAAYTADAYYTVQQHGAAGGVEPSYTPDEYQQFVGEIAADRAATQQATQKAAQLAAAMQLLAGQAGCCTFAVNDRGHLIETIASEQENEPETVLDLGPVSAFAQAVKEGYTGTAAQWLASLKGEKGADGAAGKDGKNFEVLGLYETFAALQAAHPVGTSGEAWAVGNAQENAIYLWNTENLAWQSVGSLKGEQGAKGDAGAQGPVGPQGEQGPKGDTGDITTELTAAKQAAESAADAAASSANVASSNATAATASAESASASAGAAANSAQSAAASAALSQSVTQGQKGYFATPEALKAAYPDASGEVGWWAIIGSTDTIWVWDNETVAWINSARKIDLSGYYTQNQTDTLLALKATVTDLTAESQRAQEGETAAKHAAEEIAAPIEMSTTAAAAHGIGTFFVLSDRLYKATAAIAMGDTISENVNCTATTMGAFAEQLNRNLANLKYGTGTYLHSSDGGAVTFAAAFATECTGVIVTPFGASDNVAWVTAKSKTGFTVLVRHGSSWAVPSSDVSFSWVAFGD